MDSFGDSRDAMVLSYLKKTDPATEKVIQIRPGVHILQFNSISKKWVT